MEGVDECRHFFWFFAMKLMESFNFYSRKVQWK